MRDKAVLTAAHKHRANDLRSPRAGRPDPLFGSKRAPHGAGSRRPISGMVGSRSSPWRIVSCGGRSCPLRPRYRAWRWALQCEGWP